MTVTYVFPFNTQPTIEQMRRHNLLIADVADIDSPNAFIHNMNIVPGLLPKVYMIPLSQGTSGFSLPQVEFATPNELILTGDRTNGAATVRVYIERILPPLL